MHPQDEVPAWRDGGERRHGPDPVSLSRRGTHNWSESTEVPSSSLQWNRMVLLTVSLCQVHASIVHRWLLWQRSSPRATASDSSKRRGRVIGFLSLLSIHSSIHPSHPISLCFEAIRLRVGLHRSGSDTPLSLLSCDAVELGAGGSGRS